MRNPIYQHVFIVVVVSLWGSSIPLAGCAHVDVAPTPSRPALPEALPLNIRAHKSLHHQPEAWYRVTEEKATLPLTALIEAILRNNPALQADLAYYEGRLERIAQETSLPDPSAQLKVARSTGGIMEVMRPELDPAAPPKKTGMPSTVAYTLQVMQPLPWPEKLRLKGQIAAAEAAIAFESHNIRLLDAIHSLSRTYYALSFEYAALALMREEKHYLEQYLEAVSVGYAVGRHGRQALLKAQTELARLDNEILGYPGRLASLRANLRATVGDREVAEALLDSRRVTPLDQLAMPLPESTPDELLANAMRLLPEATQIERQAELGRLSQALARADYRPDFTVGLEYMNSAARSMSMDATGRRDTVGLMVGLTIPVPNARRRAQQAEARLIEREAHLRKQALEVNTFTALEGAFEGLYSLADRLTVYDEGLIPLALETYETSRVEYETGAGDYLNMLDAVRLLITMREDQLTLKRDYLLLLADIQRITGVRFFFSETHRDTKPTTEDSLYE